MHNPVASGVALFISALVYAGIFAYLYYDIYINVDRKEELKRWVHERQRIKENEMHSFQGQGQSQHSAGPRRDSSMH